MQRFDAILFDFDGVLLDTEPVHFECWLKAIQPLGIHMDWKLYQKYCIGLDDARVVEFLAGLADPPLQPEEIWDVYPRKRALFLESVVDSPPFSTETIALLKSLQTYKLAVVSSSDSTEIEPVLEAGNLRSLFEAVVCAGDVERRKPAPDPYLLAASRLTARAPLVIEDSEAGIQSGLAAGFEVLRVADPAEMPRLVQAKLRG